MDTLLVSVIDTLAGELVNPSPPVYARPAPILPRRKRLSEQWPQRTTAAVNGISPDRVAVVAGDIEVTSPWRDRDGARILAGRHRSTWDQGERAGVWVDAVARDII